MGAGSVEQNHRRDQHTAAATLHREMLASIETGNERTAEALSFAHFEGGSGTILRGDGATHLSPLPVA